MKKMKTLDEVIKALEICTSGYCSNRDGDCPYLNIDNDCDTRLRKLDALHYLKEYQKDKQIYSYSIARRYLDLAERNDPLTWNELKTMEGKPVWLVNTATEEAEWVLVGEWFDDDEMRICRMFRDDADYISRELYGDTWQAYRKERE